MIHINRANVSIPTVLDFSSPNSKGFQEKIKTIEYYEKGENDGFPFSVYSDPEIQKSLATLFHDKCAYCESLITSTSDLQVEHYRPKNRIRIKESWTRNGYYWLAADWENLFPSCTRCNQLRRYIDDSGNIITRGKGSYFPLEDESKRVLSHKDEINHERPLLLNPCTDNPEEHLRFLEDGSVTHRTEKGKHSISVYALFRSGLKKARYISYISFMPWIDEINLVLNELQHCNDTIEKKIKLERLGRYLHNLSSYAEESKPYSGLAKQFIKDYKEKIQGELNSCVMI